MAPFLIVTQGSRYANPGLKLANAFGVKFKLSHYQKISFSVVDFVRARRL